MALYAALARQAGGRELVSHGELTIPQTWTADLDEGILAAEPESDIWVERRPGKRYFFTPVNGATATAITFGYPTASSCLGLHLSSGSLSIGAMPLGAYFMVRTNRGQCAEVRLVGKPTDNDDRVTVTFRTWHR
jgi:hypothetical protein